MSLWLKLKYLFQEAAILVFLVVLCLFNYAENTELRHSKTFEVLEIVVIVAVIFAIACEILLMIYTIYDAISKLIKARNKAKQDADSKIAA
jgi:predicted membrane protein